jgi:membrane-bound lytic murein transglycosylase F
LVKDTIKPSNFATHSGYIWRLCKKYCIFAADLKKVLTKTFTMNYVVRRFVFILLFIVASSINFSFKYSNSTNYNDSSFCLPGNSFLDKLATQGYLTVAICKDTDGLYISDGQPIGFQYDLLVNFASHLGLKLKLVPYNSNTDAISAIRAQKVDLFSGDFNSTQVIDSSIKLSCAFDSTNYILVHHKNTSIPKKGSPATFSGGYHNAKGLSNNIFVTIYNTPKLTSIAKTAFWRSNGELSLEFTSKPLNKVLNQIAEGSVQFTLLEEHIAQLQAAQFPKLSFESLIDSHTLRWAVSMHNQAFMKYTSDWVSSYSKTSDFKSLKAKYTNKAVRATKKEAGNTLAKVSTISEYDELLKSLSRSLKWDWRLLAALISQESGFRHFSRSPDGAIGLMQIMPSTALKLGMDSITGPHDNIKGGVKYLRLLQKSWERLIPDPEERIKFVLASYNVGIGHVYDARNLAAKYHYNPNKWNDNVEFFMQKKTLPAYYNDPVVKLGYCRGNIPIKYVSEIYERYELYCALAKR